MNEKSLYDTGFLFAVLGKDDARHANCSAIYKTEERVLLPETVIPELAYMGARHLGHQKLISFLRSVVAGEFVLGSGRIRACPDGN